MKQTDDEKKEFLELLRSTGREGIEYVIEDLEKWGFFKAPASANNHYNFEGGLVKHSLNTCKAALALKQALEPLEPSLVEVKDESIIIATLLHDVCKTDIYQLSNKKCRNEIGVWEDTKGYKVTYRNFPMGHGEKSVILLLCSGLELEDDEMLAIRWHMGPWRLNFDNLEEQKNYDAARKLYPLVNIVHLADTISANLLEPTGAETDNL